MKCANWLPVEGYEGIYVVSYGGHIKSLRTGKRLKTFKTEKGYRCVWLYDENLIRKRRKVHRIVAIAHIPNPRRLSDVNHKFGRKWDNRAIMLEWMSRLENLRHAHRTGLITYNNGKVYKIKTHGRYQTKAKRRRDKQSNKGLAEPVTTT